MNPVVVQTGNSPLILGQPHGGTYIPDDIAVQLNENGLGFADTDWHINRLFNLLVDDVTVVGATFHRYVIDANRDPAGVSLYPGQNTTMLCPTTDFDGKSIWREGYAPGAAETERRRREFHVPYHKALAEQIARIKAVHGFAILFDCHSIRSNIPFLFDGTLPVFNTGTNDSKTCHFAIEQAVVDVCEETDAHSHILNGRFKGGWTTRHYGNPQSGVHAIQMELAQRSYMHERPPWDYALDKASDLRPHLKKMLQRLQDMSPSILAISKG